MVSNLRERVCLLPPEDSSTAVEGGPSINELLQMTEAEIWMLPKAELRKRFIALQNHAKDPKSSSGSLPRPPLPPAVPTFISPLLKLPREIREIIYSHLLSEPHTPPVRGPHPRQLQKHLSLSCTFTPCLLLTSRQLHAEALRTFYGHTNQNIHISIDYDVWTHKLTRSPLILSPSIMASMRNFHIYILLGSEKRNALPSPSDAGARLAVVKKGARKLCKWLSAPPGGEVRRLVIHWHEPPKSFTWEMKRDILDEFRALRAESVELGVVNWGLVGAGYGGRKWKLRDEYLRTLERSWSGDAAVLGGRITEDPGPKS